jgi:hypothetical protein
MLKHKVEVSSIFHTRLGHFLVVNSVFKFSFNQFGKHIVAMHVNSKLN